MAHNSLLATVKVPSQFKYKYDFDKHGALYFLGTKGYTRSWCNPDSDLQLVRSFASSISQGRPSDIVGRQVVNFRTLN
jgi:hypothetical protein